jgi:hypothetical protein
VELDVAPVAVPGARSQGEPLVGKPVAGQVHAERRPDAATVTPVLRGETCSERLGLGPVGAGRVPPAAFPARDRIDPFVDHRVETVPVVGPRIRASTRLLPGGAVPSGGTHRWNMTITAVHRHCRPGREPEQPIVSSVGWDASSPREPHPTLQRAEGGLSGSVLGFRGVVDLVARADRDPSRRGAHAVARGQDG